MVIHERYRIVRSVGQPGNTYQAVDQHLGRTVALRHMPHGSAQESRAIGQRLQRFTTLHHPALPDIFDHFANESGHFLAMEFVPGPDLEWRTQQRTMPFAVNEALPWVYALLDALRYLHTQAPAIVHGNMSPRHIKFTARGQIKLLSIRPGPALTGQQSAESYDEETPSSYYPPEYIAGDTLEPRSDLYALGAVLYRLITNSEPVDARSRSQAAEQGKPDPLPAVHTANPEVPAALSEVIMQALSLDIDERPHDAAAMRAALEEAAPASPEPAPAPAPRPLQTSMPVTEPLPVVTPEQPKPAPLPPEAAEPQDSDSMQDGQVLWIALGGIMVILVLIVLAIPYLSNDTSPDSTASATTTTLEDSGEAAGAAGTEVSTATATSTASRTPRTTATRTPRRTSTATPTAEASPTPSPEPTGTPQPAATAASFALVGTPVAYLTTTFSVDNAAEMEELARWQGHADAVYDLAFSPDGQTLASGGFDSTVRLWNTADGTLQLALKEHEDAVWAVDYVPDGQTLVSGTGENDGAIRLWNVNDGTLRDTLVGHVDGTRSIDVSPDGQALASASWDATIRLWSNGSLLASLTEHTGPVYQVEFDPDSLTLASASADETVRLWDAEDGTLLDTMGHTDPVWSLAFSPDGQTLASGSEDGSVNFWQFEEAGDFAFDRFIEGHSEEVLDLAFSPDGQLLASASADGTIRLWQPDQDEPLKTLEGHTGPVSSVAFSPDGQRLASTSWDGTVRLWGLKP